ncbi:MAG: prepilin-type N-terminal cleavage/methylation domain-containing protein [Actinobacteria bacterium]|nr:prepilin-type N-terminal cleavage/methylation domain-containing protein [Actinomycetota bacterium]MCA1719582.1 prepilin-type N-terminal cleavage/methylation domain-containing protein [Actinomycetota bacterium]
MLSRGDDSGFTLVEMLVAIIITGVVMAPLGTAIVVGLRTTDATNTRLAESHDAQFLGEYLVPDLQSAAQVEPAPTTTVCSSDGTGGVLRLRWSDPASTTMSVPVVVTYVVQTVGTERQLHRILCTGATPVLGSDVVVAHALSASGPTVACASAAGATTSCSSPTTPALVTVTATAASGYSYAVTGSRRTS